MEAPELEVVKETVEEKPAQAGIFIKFIVLILLPTLYSIGLVMLLLHFAGVNIQTQVKTVGNVSKPIVSLFNVPKKTSPSEEKKGTESSTEKKNNNEEVPYSSNNDESAEDNQTSNIGNQTNSKSNIENNISSDINGEITEPNNLSIESSNGIYTNLKPEQIASILMGIDDRNEILKQFKKLDSKTASKVITLINPELAGWIVTQID